MGFPFPDIPAIVPLWVDVDTRRSGRLYVQSGAVPALLGRANKDTRRAFSKIAKKFNATWALVATWDKVGLFDKQRDKVRTTGGHVSWLLQLDNVLTYYYNLTVPVRQLVGHSFIQTVSESVNSSTVKSTCLCLSGCHACLTGCRSSVTEWMLEVFTPTGEGMSSRARFSV